MLGGPTSHLQAKLLALLTAHMKQARACYRCGTSCVQRVVTFWTGRSLYHLLVQARHQELSPVGLLLFWWYAAAGFISRHRPQTFSATFPWRPSAAAFCTARTPR